MPYVVSLDATTILPLSTFTVEFSPATIFTVPTGALSLLRLIVAPIVLLFSVFAATEVVYSGTLTVDLIAEKVYNYNITDFKRRWLYEMFFKNRYRS